MLKMRITRYILVGGVAYFIEIGILYYLHHYLKLSSITSVAISFWIGFLAAFVLQKYIAFQNYEKDKRTISKQMTFYTALVIWNYLFSLVLVKLFSGTSVVAIRTMAIVITTLWNYIIYRLIFNEASL
jgi:putative flippase GtrA